MRLLIVGSLNGQLTAATRIAMDKGASVLQADTIETALRTLRSGRGADSGDDRRVACKSSG